MSDVPPGQEPTFLHLSLEPTLAGGVYSDLAVVWHNQHGFTLDFFALGPPGGRDEEGRPVQPGTAVARVKVPPGVIFQIAKAIADNVRKYEDIHGAITPEPTDVTWEEAQDDRGDEQPDTD